MNLTTGDMQPLEITLVSRLWVTFEAFLNIYLKAFLLHVGILTIYPKQLPFLKIHFPYNKTKYAAREKEANILVLKHFFQVKSSARVAHTVFSWVLQFEHNPLQ